MAIAPSNEKRVRAMEREILEKKQMKHLLRPRNSIALAPIAVMVVGVAMVLMPPGSPAQSTGIGHILQTIDPLLSHSSSQGYLGVLVSDVDNDSATKLKLKEVRGALITLIDHDAPAGQMGLKVNDVVMEVNAQKVEGAEQFGRMLREIPAGRKVTLLISRDGSPQTVEVQLVDRKVMEQDVWNKLGHQGETSGTAPALGIISGGGDAPMPGFHMPFLGSSLNVGALVEPLAPQTADYLGIPSGIMVKQVARKSEAAAAGLKAHDVILKVGTEAITTTADWDRALRSNQGKPVQVTILRYRKQQTVNLQVDSKHKSEVDFQDVFPGLLPDGPCPLLAELDPAWGADAQAAAEQLRQQAEEFRQKFNVDDFKIDQKQMDELRKQMEQFRQSFKADDFKLNQKQLDDMKKQMEQFRQNFNIDQFKIDPKQMEELKRQMEEMRKSMPELFQFNKQQLEQFRQQIQEMRLGIDQHV
jgi:membrane-associated protease RseP (regulator of RpoE activity)